MNSALSALYRFCLAWTEFDMTVARSTGRNPAQIAALARDRDHYQSLLCKIEIQRGSADAVVLAVVSLASLLYWGLV